MHKLQSSWNQTIFVLVFSKLTKIFEITIYIKTTELYLLTGWFPVSCIEIKFSKKKIIIIYIYIYIYI